MQQIDFNIRGVAPMIHHNAQLSDPLNEWVKKIQAYTSKRKKTIEDHEEIARLEWFGSLYLNESGPVVPASNLERMLRDAAAKSKLGKQVQAGLLVLEDAPVIYKGPKDPTKMWDSQKFFTRASCKIGQQRVIRTRPSWDDWELKFIVQFDESMLDENKIRDFVSLAGRVCGLGDWRPKYGRFEVTK